MRRRKARVVFGLMVEPIVLGREAYQHAGRLPIADNDDLLALGFVQKPGKIVLDFEQR